MLEMNFFTDVPKILLVTTIFALMIPSALPFDCSHSLGNIKCECTATAAECSGTQTNLFEAEEILKNLSRTENVVFKINDLQFDSDFILEDSSINNLTLGYTKFGLQVLSTNFFSKLGSSLISLNVQNNSINNIDDYFFSNFSVLTELFIDNNDIQNLTSDSFRGLNNLKYLSLSYNDIGNIMPEFFQSLTSLEKVVLSYNKFLLIENINIKSSTLKELRIDNCLIEGLIDKNTLENIPNTEQLDVSYNRISAIKTHSLSSLKNLKYLNLSHNVIERLEENAFSEIHNLTTLALQANKISVIKLSSFEKLQNLKYLDLSGNRLTAMLCEYTTDFISLEKIYLQNNEIKDFTHGAFFYSPKLKTMDMTGNNLECSCPLTESALYLIENGTMERGDLESVSCIISLTGSQMPVTKYESSKCVPVEPCKKIEVAEEEEYEYEDEDTTTISTTDKSFTAISLSTKEILFETSTDVPTTQLILNETETGSTTESLITTTEYNASNTTLLSTDTEDTTIPFTETTAEFYTGNVSEEPNTTHSSEVTTLNYILNETDSTMEPSTTNKINISNIVTVSADLEDTTVSLNKTTLEFYSEITSDVSSEESNITTSVSSDIMTANTLTTPTSKIISTDSESDCSSLQLTIDKTHLGSDLAVFKNFSNKENMLCLKWTASGIEGLKLKIQCSIKYNVTGTKYTKTKNLVCPSFEYEIKDYTLSEKISKFCIIIYHERKKIQDSCATFVSGTTTLTTFISTSTPSTILPISANTMTSITTTEITTTESYTLFDDTTTTNVTSTTHDEIPTIPDKSTTDSTFIMSEKTDADTTFTTSTKEVSIINLRSFEITTLNLYFNDSKLAFTTWTVNKWQPLNECNLTLKISTQYFDGIEGVFPCTNNTYRLTKVKEDDIFKVCLFSYHVISGKDNRCQHTLPSAKASASKDDTVNNSLIPLICLLVLVGLLILFIVIKNISKKRSVSKKYDVRAEEEKYQERTKLRPQSVQEESVRFSYIVKENHEYI